MSQWKGYGAFLKLLCQHPPNPSLVSCLHASPSSHQPPWGDNYLSQVLSTGAPASHTGFMFQVSGTWHRAARGPRPPCKHPSLARGHYSPASPTDQAPDLCAPAWFGLCTQA